MFTFRGGVHPYDGKDLTKDKMIIELPTDNIMVFPMSQHLGAPANPVVKKGDRVLVGQIIGEAGGFISANVISSVSGKVKAVELRTISTGYEVMCVVVENDMQFETVENYGVERDYTKLTNDEIRAIVRNSGIVGMGGAGFPADVKLSTGNDDAITDIIINGSECEPYITADYRLMLEKSDDLISGIKILLQMYKNASVHIGIENNKPDAIKILQEKCINEERISVKPLKTKYPQGGERMLIYAITGRKINSKKLPKDVGCIVINVDTIISIYRAVALQIPLHYRVVTVSGDAIKEPNNYRVQNGTSVESLLNAAGGFSKPPYRLIAGGPMMGTAQYSADIPTTKGLSALLCMSADAISDYEATNCIRCGKCVDVCPEFLAPVIMMEDVENSEFDLFEKHNGMECIECGSCAYICPARRKLTQNFKLGKAKVMQKRRMLQAKEKNNG